MIEKIKIDNEINLLNETLGELEDIHPDYISPELRDLQAKVLATHVHLETAIEIRILYEIERILRLNNVIVSKALTLLAIEPLLNNLSYRNKTEVMEALRDPATKRRIANITTEFF